MSRYRISKATLTAIVCALAMTGPTRAIEINVSYQFDTQGFFDLQARRDALEAATSVFEVFTDSLGAINPGMRYNVGTPQEFADTWTAHFEHPGQAGDAAVVDLEINADSLIIYAGGKNLSGNTLAFSGPGGFSVNGVPNFVSAVSTRGQSNTTGENPTDFARWGGGITFDTLTSVGQPRSWHANHSTLPPAGATDIYTVALHELGHLFGFAKGTAQSPLSFDTRLDDANHRFVGPQVTEVYGAAAPTASDGSAHWQSSAMSVASGNPQLAVMVSTIPAGVRRYFTALDYAAMADIGWQVPESVFDVPLLGDYDGSGSVNANDLAIWRRTFGSTTSLAADGNGNLRVDAGDYTVWRNRLGATNGSGSSSAVPEPAGLLLAFLGGLVSTYVACRSGMRPADRRGAKL
jgi:hypothetical protein